MQYITSSQESCCLRWSVDNRNVVTTYIVVISSLNPCLSRLIPFCCFLSLPHLMGFCNLDLRYTLHIHIHTWETHTHACTHTHTYKRSVIDIIISMLASLAIIFSSNRIKTLIFMKPWILSASSKDLTLRNNFNRLNFLANHDLLELVSAWIISWGDRRFWHIQSNMFLTYPIEHVSKSFPTAGHLFIRRRKGLEIAVRQSGKDLSTNGNKSPANKVSNISRIAHVRLFTQSRSCPISRCSPTIIYRREHLLSDY